MFLAASPPGWGPNSYRQWLMQVTAHGCGVAAGAMAVAAMLFAVGSVTGRPGTWFVGAVGMPLALLAARLLPLELTGSRWRVPQVWAQLGRVPYSAAFGVALGTGVLTKLSSPGFYVVLAWELAAPSWPLVWPVAAAFAAGRIAPFLLITVRALRHRRHPAPELTPVATRLARLPRFEAAAVAAVAAVLLNLPGCTAASHPARGPVTLAPTQLVALDASGALTAYTTDTLAVRWRVNLAAGVPLRFGKVSVHALAAGADDLIFAVAPVEDARPTLFAVDGQTGAVRLTVPLPQGVRFQVPVVDDARKRVYVLGSRPTGRRDGRLGVVAVVDLVSHRVTMTVSVGHQPERQWLPYAGELFDGSSRLAISYHGPDTTGIDVRDAATLDPVPCDGSSTQQCTTQPHGLITAYPGGLIAATGTQLLLLLDANGRTVRQLDTKLTGNHLMEFAFDSTRRTIYALGSCGYAGGLSKVPLSTGASTLLRAPLGMDMSAVDDRICGDRVAMVNPGSVLAVINPGSVLAVVAPTRLQLVDTSAGEIRRTRTTDVLTIDAVVTSLRPATS